MKPVYFPFCFMEEEKVERLAFVFQRLIVYLPSEKIISECINTDIFEPRILEKYQERLDGLVREYIEWADIHRGGELRFFAKNRIYNEGLISRIKADIKNFSSEDIESDYEDIVEAGLFLYIAYEFDKYNSASDADVKRCFEMEKRFISAIDGTDEKDEDFFLKSGSPDIEQDRGAVMTDMRIRSWARFLLYDNIFEKEKDVFFITDSRAISEYIKERTESDFTIITDIKSYNSQDVEMEPIVSFFRKSEDENPGIFKEYIIIKRSPERFFADIIGNKSILKRGEQNETVICLF